MKWLIWSIRSAFCKHEWNIEETLVNKVDSWDGSSRGGWERVSATCKKCGWHRKYWKY